MLKTSMVFNTPQQKKVEAQMKILAAVCHLPASTAAQSFISPFILVSLFTCYCEPRVVQVAFLFWGLGLLREAVMPRKPSHIAFWFAVSRSQIGHLQMKFTSHASWVVSPLPAAPPQAFHPGHASVCCTNRLSCNLFPCLSRSSLQLLLLEKGAHKSQISLGLTGAGHE